MPIKFNCHRCGAKLRVPEEHIGKMARCPKCDEKCLVPEFSQRAPESVAASDFDNIEALDSYNLPTPSSPVSLPPAVSVPESAPPLAPPPPAMATPVNHALPPTVPQPFASPYAAPVGTGKQRTGSVSSAAYRPLYEARTMMKIFGWANFALGIIYCIMIVGILVGWLFIWLGWLVKGAGEAITIGVESNDESQIRLANERLATYFRIMGVLTIIGLVIMALYFLFIIAIIVIGIVGAAANA